MSKNELIWTLCAFEITKEKKRETGTLSCWQKWPPTGVYNLLSQAAEMFT